MCYIISDMNGQKSTNGRKGSCGELTVCLAGNPNSGKTTLFNQLTGSRQKVGNYPGVTVEHVMGSCSHRGYSIDVVDLPGTYSLTAASQDELVARDFIIDQKPDLVVYIADATTLSRSLYLAVQIKELGVPILIALNKWDLVEHQKLRINIQSLQYLFGAPCVPCSAVSGNGVALLLDKAVDLVEGKLHQREVMVSYQQELENEIEKVTAVAATIPLLAAHYHPRWLAIKLLENDRAILAHVEQIADPRIADLLAHVERSRQHVESVFGDECAIIITEGRYGFIQGALKESSLTPGTNRLDISDRIDRLLLSPGLGVPAFLLVMLLLFFFPFQFGAPLTELVSSGFESLAALCNKLLPAGWLRSMLVDGIIGGVGGVLVFLPQILLLFAGISFLEASGYMARAAFVVDKFMHRLGLHGKSFVPMIVGFGCSVPALLASRTLENKQDRLTTMLVIPFMSCSARLPVYFLIVGALFPRSYHTLALFSIYLLGILVAVITAKLFRKFVYRGDRSHFVMELPPYRLPTLWGVLHQMWEKAWLYIKKAGTLLVVASVVFWFLTRYPALNQEHRQQRAREEAKVVTAAEAKSSMLLKKGDIPPEGTSWATVSNHPPLLAMISNISMIDNALQREQKRLAPHSLHARELLLSHNRQLEDLSNRNPQIYRTAQALLGIREERDSGLEAIRNRYIALEKKQSYAGRLGVWLAPALAPAGLDDWRVSVALISGFIAKEVVVSTLGAIYGLGEGSEAHSTDLHNRIRQDPLFLSKTTVAGEKVGRDQEGYYLKDNTQVRVVRTPGGFRIPNVLLGYVLMVFVLLYVPCQAATIVYIREAGIKNALIMITYTTGLAYVLSVLVYQTGRLLGLG